MILYELLTGETPFKGDTPVSKIVARLQVKPPSPREKNREVPGYLERIVLKCLEVDPELRYQNAEEVLQDLERGAGRSIALAEAAQVGRAQQDLDRGRLLGGVCGVWLRVLCDLASTYGGRGRRSNEYRGAAVQKHHELRRVGVDGHRSPRVARNQHCAVSFPQARDDGTYRADSRGSRKGWTKSFRRGNGPAPSRKSPLPISHFMANSWSRVANCALK